MANRVLLPRISKSWNFSPGVVSDRVDLTGVQSLETFSFGVSARHTAHSVDLILVVVKRMVAPCLVHELAGHQDRAVLVKDESIFAEMLN